MFVRKDVECPACPVCGKPAKVCETDQRVPGPGCLDGNPRSSREFRKIWWVECSGFAVLSGMSTCKRITPRGFTIDEAIENWVTT
jgi:hypothetical protein